MKIEDRIDDLIESNLKKFDEVSSRIKSTSLQNKVQIQVNKFFQI